MLVELAPGAGRGPVRAFATNRGGVVRYEYNILPNLINLRNIPVTALAGLRRIPGVVRVTDDVTVHANLAESTPLIRGLHSQVTNAGFAADGSGIRVCILGTGIDSDHVMYADRIDTTAGRDFVNNDNDSEDDAGHGSHVAGIAAGGIGPTFHGEPFQGVAPEATLIGVKVLDETGTGQSSDVIAGIDYCADQTSGGRADVINMSLGYGAFSEPCDTDETAAAANAAVDNGVVVVASAGNDAASNALGAPACGSKVISVGATWDITGSYPDVIYGYWLCGHWSVTADEITCFSNQSEMLDVVAPGCDIYSAYPDLAGIGANNGVEMMCGTSQSSPHVAGLAALLLSAEPGLSPAAVRHRIRQGAIDLGLQGFDPTYGYGRIDVINSLAAGPSDQPPTVSIVNPDGGAPVSGTVTVQIDATDAEDSAGSLTVEWNVDSETAWQMATYNTGTGYYESSWDTTAVVDGSHTIHARATDSVGKVANATNGVTVDNVSTGPPAAPSNLRATAIYQSTAAGKPAKPGGGGGKNKPQVDHVALNWADNSSNEDGFSIERCEVLGKGKNKSCTFGKIGVSSANATGYDDANNVQNGTTYRYRVKATNSQYGDSGYSNVAEVKP